MHVNAIQINKFAQCHHYFNHPFLLHNNVRPLKLQNHSLKEGHSHIGKPGSTLREMKKSLQITYESVKYLLNLSILFVGYFKDDLLCHFAASMISGLATTIASMPVDIAKTR